jgi:hypothetical protein
MDERRASPRAQPRKTTLGRVIATQPTHSLAALVQNVSARGVGLLANVPLEPRSMLWLELAGALPLGARVAHATRQEDGTWLLGCELIEPFDCDALSELKS